METDWCSDGVINGTWETDTVEYPGDYDGTSVSFKGDIYIFGGSQAGFLNNNKIHQFG